MLISLTSSCFVMKLQSLTYVRGSHGGCYVSFPAEWNFYRVSVMHSRCYCLHRNDRIPQTLTTSCNFVYCFITSLCSVSINPLVKAIISILILFSFLFPHPHPSPRCWRKYNRLTQVWNIVPTYYPSSSPSRSKQHVFVFHAGRKSSL